MKSVDRILRNSTTGEWCILLFKGGGLPSGETVVSGVDCILLKGERVVWRVDHLMSTVCKEGCRYHMAGAWS